MSKIFRLSPIPSHQEHPDDDHSTLLTPSSPIPSRLVSSEPFTSSDSQLQTDTKTSSTHRSNVILSFFLSPSGYTLLRLDHKSRKVRSATQRSTPKDPRTSNAEALKWLSTSLISPEEYKEWFISQRSLPTDANYPIISSHPEDVSSATRAGIRGFSLAFVAATCMDVLLPAALKRNFRGIIHRIITNTSALSTGVSVGAFALIYRLVFQHITLVIDYVIPRYSLPSRWSKRSDSGILLEVPETGDRMEEQYSQEQAAGDRAIVDEEYHKIRSRRKWIPAIVATLVASPAFALIPQQSRRLMLAMYFLTYAGESVYAAFEHTGYMGWMPNWMSMAVIYPFICAYDTHTFIQHPDSCPIALRNLIVAQSNPYLVKPPQFNTATHGPFPPAVDLLKGMANCVSSGFHNTRTIAPELVALGTASATPETLLVPESCARVWAFTEGMGYDTMGCRFLHPNTASCTTAAMSIVNRNLKWTFRLYSTLAVVMTLTRGRRAFKDGLLKYIKDTTIQIIRSMIGTSGLMLTAFPMWCWIGRFFPSKMLVSQRYYLNGFFGGLWILFESQKRQSELTLYFIRFMLESMWRRMAQAGYVRNIKYGETLIFGLAMSVIMGVFESMPTLHRKGLIQSALTKIFVD
ncbi:hypothetical protein BGX31_000933 [Mortierella sp. GBA43]|nr:hypothetical protein BGX31_000933 [Mortierella sp. GBA43]